MSMQRCKTGRDAAGIALSVDQKAIGDQLAGKLQLEELPAPDIRNPAAAALSNLSVFKDNKARAEKLGPKKRSVIAKKRRKRVSLAGFLAVDLV